MIIDGNFASKSISLNFPLWLLFPLICLDLPRVDSHWASELERKEVLYFDFLNLPVPPDRLFSHPIFIGAE
jgi:hypothetical protein